MHKYLSRWAEPEHAAAREVHGSWRHVLVVVAKDEPVALLDGLAAACRASEALVVLVVNAPASAPERVHAANRALLGGVLALDPAPRRLGTAPPVWQLRARGFDLVLVDRAGPGSRLPERQGVGLARRIGSDLALALGQTGRIASSWIHSTDADVELPQRYFEVERPRDAVGLVYPFFHVPSGDVELDLATLHYELSLRYYVLGLRHAGSPYAFHTIGSALAVRADAYAAVRGFPRRLAGEDFHLLDKLAKVGSIARVASEPIRIRARRSDRVPFGTGPGARRLEHRLGRAEEPELHHPAGFELVGSWLRALDEFARDRDPGRLRERVAAEPLLARGLARLGALEAAHKEAAQAPDAARLRRRLHTSFGALETLRLVHALRDSGLGVLPWQAALARAPFCAGLADAPPGDVVHGLCLRETTAPERDAGSRVAHDPA